MSADKVYLDEVTGGVRSKKIDGKWVFYPGRHYTGRRQPVDEQVRIVACADFTADYKVFFDHRGALDAPELIPAGGVSAMSISDADALFMSACVLRDGWQS